MPIITLKEIFNFAIISFVIGYIFSGFIQLRIKTVYDYMHPKRFDWRALWFAILIAAPAVILHELGHKFIAMLFGLKATFFVWYPGLAIGVFLKLIAAPFILIAPGYVQIIGQTSHIGMAIIAFAGPFVNLTLWVGSAYVLKNYNRKLSQKWISVLGLTKIVNQWLFIFNMIPIPPLDGSKVLWNLVEVIV